jgi:hypothetical protein
MRTRFGAAVLLALLAASGPATAQNFAPASLDSWFRLEWTAAPSAKGPHLSGYVYNTTNRRAIRMRLAIDGLDPAGNVVAHTETWVLGSVPPNNRSYFQSPVPPAADYRVAVLYFDWEEDHGGGFLLRW